MAGKGTQMSKMMRRTADATSGMLAAGSEEDVKNRMVVQGLVYDFPASFSACKQRQMLEQTSQNQSYKVTGSGQTIVIYFSSGEWSINPRNTYLTFNVKSDYTDWASAGLWDATTLGPSIQTGPGGFYNMFSMIRLLSASGQEILNYRNPVYYTNVCDNFTKNKTWFDSANGALEGYSVTATDYETQGDPALFGIKPVSRQGVSVATGNGSTSQLGVRACLPLSKLLGIFDVDCLLPPYLISGMRLELQMAPPQRAFIYTPGTVPGFTTSAPAAGYTMSDIRINSDTYALDAPIQGIMQKQAAETGLEIVFQDREIIQNQIQGVTTANINIRKAVGRANCSYSVVQDSDALQANAAGAALPSASALYWPITDYQYQLAGNFFPPAGVKSPYGIAPYTDLQSFSQRDNADGLIQVQVGEPLWYALRAFQANNALPAGIMAELDNFAGPPVPGPIGGAGIDYKVGGGDRIAQAGSGIIAVNLQRSDEVCHSGLPLSMSRQLSLQVNFNQDFGTEVPNATITTVLLYTKAVKVWLDRVNVRD